MDRGFPEVSFVNEVRREAFLPHEPPISVTATAPSLLDQLGKASKMPQGSMRALYADHVPVQRYPSYPTITESAGGAIRSQRSNTNMDTVEMSESPEPRLASPTQHREYNERPKLMEETLQDIRRATGLAGLTSSRNPVGPNRISAVSVPETTEVLPRMRMTTGHYKVKSFSVCNLLLSLQASASSYGILGHLISTDSSGDTGDYTGSAYSTCQLCQNKIMASRLSNLTNHVRRHAVMKQYKCRHCDYGHNEQAKVGATFMLTH